MLLQLPRVCTTVVLPLYTVAGKGRRQITDQCKCTMLVVVELNAVVTNAVTAVLKRMLRLKTFSLKVICGAMEDWNVDIGAEA